MASCSSLIPLKRVGLLIEALSDIKDIAPDGNVKWVHFGDGELRQLLEKQANEYLK